MSLQDLLLIIGGCALIGLVSAIGPAVWRALPRLWDHFVDRPIGDLIAFFTSSWDGSEDGRTGSSSGSDIAVLTHQNQESQNQNANFEAVQQFLAQHNLTDEQAIIILANMRRQSGDDLLSANKIRDVVGGADAVVKAQVASQRKAKPKPQQPRSIYRPRNGWQA